MVSRKWPPVVGEDDSSTVWRFRASIDEVSQQSNSSAVLTRSRRLIESDCRLRRLRLLGNRRVLDEMGFTAFVKEEATDEKVSAAENLPLDAGGYFESIETSRVVGSEGLVLLYGIVLTRVVGKRRPTSCMFGEFDLLSSGARSRMKRATRNSSCMTKEDTRATDSPARNPIVVLPRAVLLDKQMSVATVSTAAMTQRTIPEPNSSPVTALASCLIEAIRTHDNRVSTADSNTDDVMAVTRVGDLGLEQRSARMILRMNRTVVANIAKTPSTAEAQDGDILMLLLLVVAVLNSCVRNVEWVCGWSKTDLVVWRAVRQCNGPKVVRKRV